HRRAERSEKQLRNIEKERAQHEKVQLERLYDGLKGHDWLKVMGISGITESEKRSYEPKRDHFIYEVGTLLSKFKEWKEEEKRRKFERERASTTDAEEDDDGEEEEIYEGKEDNEDENNRSRIVLDGANERESFNRNKLVRKGQSLGGRTTIGKSRRHPSSYTGILSPLMEKPFTSFYSKPYLRDAAIGKRRRGRTRFAFGQPLPEIPYRAFELPPNILSEETRGFPRSSDGFNMANPTDSTITQPPRLGFSVSFQKIDLDIDLLSRSLKGKAEVTVNPHSRDLKIIRLNCRQCAIQRVTANGRVCSSFSYEDPYLRRKLSWKASAHQHHMLRRQVEGQLKTPPEEELLINLPKSVKIDEIDPSTAEAQSASIAKLSFGSKKDSVDDTPVESIQVRSAVEPERRFTPIVLVVEYVIHNIQDGMQFVGWQEGELRYPHAYTRNSSFPGSACCLFPCLDDFTARCSWEISIKCPKTIGDALVSERQTRLSRTHVDRDPVFTTTEIDQSEFSDADKALDIAVICTGDMTDEIDDPIDTTKKTFSFSCGNLISAQHIGFAIGPFEHVDLAEFRDDEEDDKLGQNAVPLHSFCLPGRAEEVRNTCLPMAK
ncbi:MAG: hypothetical protein Q9214_006352, partial [Letrouitia sp. 1 TL-2023]